MNDSLHVTVSGEGPPVILMHGMFGMGSNLKGVARSLADGFCTCLVDLPDHGRSAWLETTDIATMTATLHRWAEREGIGKAAVLGHSLGGKVAMQYALKHPEDVAALVVADIEPVAYPPRHETIFAALDAVEQKSCTSRDEAARVMAGFIREKGVIQFLLMSLTRSEDGIYRWRFNLEGIKRNYRSLSAAVDSENNYGGPALFIRGGDSDYVASPLTPQTNRLFPHARLETIPGCGHWLHAEKPERFNELVGHFLRQQEAW